MNYKGKPCPIKEQQGIYLLCQEGDCSNCYINIELDKQTQKQLADIRTMRESSR